MRFDASRKCQQFLWSLIEVVERMEHPSVGTDASRSDFLTRLRLWRDFSDDDLRDVYTPSSEELRVVLNLLEAIAKLMPDEDLALERVKEIAFNGPKSSYKVLRVLWRMLR